MRESLFARVDDFSPCIPIEVIDRPTTSLVEDHEEEKVERDRLIKENQRLVYSLAQRYMGQGIELSDLIQIGNLGLLKAVERFDPSRGAQFGSYAFYWIQQTILLALKK